MFKNEKLNVTLFLSLIALQVLGVAALVTKFQWHYLPIMLFMYLWGGISTTLYLHRYLTHRGFEMPGWLKFIFATGSAVVRFPAILSRGWGIIVTTISNPIPMRTSTVRSTDFLTRT